MTVDITLDSSLDRLPEQACDCHFHVFDAQRYPYAEGRAYTPPDAPVQAFQAFSAQLGTERAVLIHPSIFGSDHRSFEDTLAANQSSMRGVAVVYAQQHVTSDEDIARWHALGTRGSRINALFSCGPSESELDAIAARVKPYGWHIQLLVDVVNSSAMVSRVAALDIPVVVDHFGHHEPRELLASKGFSQLLALVKEGRAWVKLSAPYRMSSDPSDWHDMQPVVNALLEANPAQLLWGSDWPHPRSPHHGFSAPSVQMLSNAIFQWLPTPELRQQILVENPTRLYWENAP